jgi:hypothetical protein
MPFPTLNAVLQMAYAEARKVASKPLAERDSPAMRQAVEDFFGPWSRTNCRPVMPRSGGLMS